MINTETDSSIHFSIHKVQQQPCSHWSTIQETQQGFCTSLYHRVYMGWHSDEQPYKNPRTINLSVIHLF